MKDFKAGIESLDKTECSGFHFFKNIIRPLMSEIEYNKTISEAVRIYDQFRVSAAPAFVFERVEEERFRVFITAKNGRHDQKRSYFDLRVTKNLVQDDTLELDNVSWIAVEKRIWKEMEVNNLKLHLDRLARYMSAGSNRVLRAVINTTMQDPMGRTTFTLQLRDTSINLVTMIDGEVFSCIAVKPEI